MNILFIGDIFGEVGRNLVKKYLPLLKDKYDIDFVIANGENTTHGKGINQEHYYELLDCGVDCVTMGNHTFDQHRILEWIDEEAHIVRPANLSRYAPGVGTTTFNVKGSKIQVTNMLCRVFYGGIINHPVEVMEDIVAASDADIHIVDLHGEATAEKIAFGYEFDGQVSAVLGTHTHVQTADERLLDGRTAYISDVGMCGPFNQCIGMAKENVVLRMKDGLPHRFEPGGEPGIFNAVVIKIALDQKCTGIERINLSPLNDYKI